LLGGEIISTFDTPDKVRLGKCDLIEEIIIGEDKLIKFSGLFFMLIKDELVSF
jgi:T-complex protein 1 subunit beta